MMAEQNYRLLQELDANRRFMLMAYRDNPELLDKAEARIKMLLVANGTEALAPATVSATKVPAKECV